MTLIKPRPARRYRLPRYPTKLQVNQRPALLARHLPPAWAARKELAGAAALLMTTIVASGAVTSAGCSPKPGNSAIGGVAPVFEHGDGVAATGCVVVCPPIYLSEDDAMPVIMDELRKNGIEISTEHRTLYGTWIPRRFEHWKRSGKEEKSKIYSIPFTSRPLETDASNPDKKIYLEYVSMKDYYKLGGPYDDFGLSVDSFDLKSLASELDEMVRKNEKGIFYGSLYDPIVTASGDDAEMIQIVELCEEKKTEPGYDRSPAKELCSDKTLDPYREERKQLVEESKNLLRQQVKDFADWLKAQGAI